MSWVSKKSTIAKAKKTTLAILRIPYFIPHMEIVFVRRGVTCCVTGDLAQCFDSMSYTQTDYKKNIYLLYYYFVIISSSCCFYFLLIFTICCYYLCMKWKQ